MVFFSNCLKNPSDLRIFHYEWISTGYQDITYSGIETVILLNAAPGADMEVRGGDVTIANGDQTPSEDDMTDLGKTPVDKEISQSFIIHNLGEVALQLADSPPVTLIGSDDFTLALHPTEDPIPPGGATECTVQCTPDDSGSRTATVSVANNDPDEDPYLFDVRCTGTVFPRIRVRGNGQVIENGDVTPTVSDHTEFGVLGDTSIARTFSIKNFGTKDLYLYNDPEIVTANHVQFTITRHPPQLIEIGATVTFEVTAYPGAESSPTATITIRNTDENEDPFTFVVHAGGSDEGTGPWPDAGEDQIAIVGERVILNGSGSYNGEASALALPA